MLSQNREGQADYVLFVAEDATEELAAHAQIHHMAHHDALTGLPNRTLFNERLRQALVRDSEHAKLTAALCLDLDNFKNINDSLGHAFGDKLLRALGKRLRRELREHDTLARLGGDEFAVVLTGLEGREAACNTAQRLINAICPPFQIEGHQFTVGVSIGIAIAPEDSDQAEQLLGYADMALYEAKRNGRNRYECFSVELTSPPASAAWWKPTCALRCTWASCSCTTSRWSTSRPAALPAMRRCCAGSTDPWHGHAHGLHPHRRGNRADPRTGQPGAEPGLPGGGQLGQRADGVGQPVGGAVQECQPGAHRGPGAGRLRPAATAVGAGGHRVGAAGQQRGKTCVPCVHWKDLGVSISLDDFGTGYSSLGYLRSFPFDRIKIDKSFVHDMCDSREAMSIIRAITDLSNSLMIKTTAEGLSRRSRCAGWWRRVARTSRVTCMGDRHRRTSG